jgi:hypothetical protein
MSSRALLTLLSAAFLAGCGQAAPAGTARVPVAVEAAATTALKGDLTRFTREDGRKITAKRVPMSDGRGACELRAPLSPEEQTLLVQLYRLHPRAVGAETFPAGLVERTKRHLTTLHAFAFPKAARLAPATLAAEMRTRVYRDGDGTVLAYESFLVGENFQLFGKYDLQGRILKVDIETW